MVRSMWYDLQNISRAAEIFKHTAHKKVIHKRVTAYEHMVTAFKLCAAFFWFSIRLFPLFSIEPDKQRRMTVSLLLYYHAP